MATEQLTQVLSMKSASPTEWKSAIAAIKTVAEEATFEATPEGLSFRGMDPSHVTLIDFSWPSTGFESYKCLKTTRFALPVQDLSRLFGVASQSDKVEVSREKAEDSLRFVLDGDIKRTFDLHLLESATSSAPIPKVEFTTKMTITCSRLKQLLEDMSIIGDQVTFAADEESLSVSAKSDIGEASQRFEKGSADILELSVTETSTAKATYSVDYLYKVLAAVKVDVVQVEFRTKKPIKFSFRLNDQGAHVDNYLAPRVSGD